MHPWASGRKREAMKEIYYEDVVTKSGLTGDVVISALQKFIRRGMVMEAAQAAYELFLEGEELAEYGWKRLLVISVEDIGMGNPNAPCVVKHLYDMSHELGYDSPDYPLLLVHGVRFLCSCQKERGSSNLAGLVKRRILMGCRLECPDYVYDMHTEEGQKRGRGYDHFFEEAALVTPRLASEGDDYEQELRKLMKEGY